MMFFFPFVQILMPPRLIDNYSKVAQLELEWKLCKKVRSIESKWRDLHKN